MQIASNSQNEASKPGLQSLLNGCLTCNIHNLIKDGFAVLKHLSIRIKVLKVTFTVIEKKFSRFSFSRWCGCLKVIQMLVHYLLSFTFFPFILPCTAFLSFVVVIPRCRSQIRRHWSFISSSSLESYQITTPRFFVSTSISLWWILTQLIWCLLCIIHLLPDCQWSAEWHEATYWINKMKGFKLMHNETSWIIMLSGFPMRVEPLTSCQPRC